MLMKILLVTVLFIFMSFLMASCMSVTDSENEYTNITPYGEDEYADILIYDETSLDLALCDEEYSLYGEDVLYVLYEEDTLTCAQRFQQDYETLNNTLRDDGEPHLYLTVRPDNTVAYLDDESIMDFLYQGTGMLFFSSATCPWCRMLIPTLLDFAVYNDVTIYYFNPVYDREADTDLHRHILEKLHDYLPVDTRNQTYGEYGFDPNLKRVTSAHVFFLRDGEVISHLFANRHEYLLEDNFNLDAISQVLEGKYDTWVSTMYTESALDPAVFLVCPVC